jgi:hypothetical protein
MAFTCWTTFISRTGTIAAGSRRIASDFRVPVQSIGCQTKPVNGRSIDLVIKYCRVGEDVPIDTITLSQFSNAEFNSPYEEFALVMEMRHRRIGPRMLTHRPLGIYVPPERLELWKTGRKEFRIAGKKARFMDIELDIFRQCVLIYQWIKGISADEAFKQMPNEERRRILKKLTERVRRDLEDCGYTVVDHKPAHIIVRPRKDGTLLRKGDGSYAYALVDFELLIRTADHQRDVQSSRRAIYLTHYRARFSASARAELFPENLKLVTILGIDYVFGHAESTHGRLWVVGHDPELFDYFIPERWRHTPGKKLSASSETYYTLTKDNINLVWKLSRVGEVAESNLPDENAADILSYGFNTPFEEFSIALDLARSEIGNGGIARRAKAGKTNETTATQCKITNGGVASGAYARETDRACQEVVGDNGIRSSAAAGKC